MRITSKQTSVFKDTIKTQINMKRDMKRENLMRMARYIQTIPQRQFDMDIFVDRNAHCGTVGCVIGHCTVLDTEENLANYPSIDDGYARGFINWSQDFTGINWIDGAWAWCFGSTWAKVDNTPIGAAERIVYFLEHGLPEDWEEQMREEAPLCYCDIELPKPSVFEDTIKLVDNE